MPPASNDPPCTRTPRGQRNADVPVSAPPMESECISEVPSYVNTDSRLFMCRMTGYSKEMPLAPRMVLADRAISMASRTLLSLP